MFGLAFDEYLSEWKHAIVIAIQIAMIMFLSIVAITLYQKQIGQYKYFKELFKSDGVVVYNDYSQINKSDIVKNCYTYKMSQLFNEDKSSNIHLYAYDEFLGNIQIEMQDGISYKDCKEKDYCPVVITENAYGYKTGDVIELLVWGEIPVKLFICGIMKNETEYLHTTSYNWNDNIYNYFTAYDYKVLNEEVHLFTSIENLEKYGIDSVYGRLAFVEFKKGVSKDEINDYRSSLISEGKSTLLFKDVDENTRNMLGKRLAYIYPFIVCMFILTIISVACSLSLNVNRSLSYYAIMFVSGMKWSGIVVIQVIKNLFNCILGFCIVFIIRFIILILKLDDDFMFEIGGNQAISVMVISSIIVFMSVVLSLFIIKENMPVQIMRQNKD